MSVDNRVRGLEARMQVMEQQVTEIHEIVTRAKGGWRVIVALGAIITGLAMIANAFSSFANWLKH